MRGRVFERCGGRRRRTQMRRKAIDRLTSSGSRCVWRANICSTVMFPRQGRPPRFVMSKPLHTMTNDEQREITLPKARSARCRREGGRGEVWSAGEVQARFGRDTGETQARRDCGRACKRDPNEIQARFTGRVAPAARRGRGEHGVSRPKQPERRGFEWRVPHGHWRTAKICGRKQKGRGQPRTKRAPRSATEATALLPPLDDVCDYRAAHVDPDPAVGVGPVRERRHEQPPLGAPAVRSERLRWGGRNR